MTRAQFTACALIIGLVIGVGLSVSNPYVRITLCFGGVILMATLAKALDRIKYEDDDRIFLLEHTLNESANTISFLHGCLTDPTFKYAYPERTQEQLDAIRKLVPYHEPCFHSRQEPGCESCEWGHATRVRLAEIEARKEVSGT